jgi:adenosine deaminase CECR1
MARGAGVVAAIVVVSACASRATLPPQAGANDHPAPITDVAPYQAARARLIEQDRATRLGAGLILTAVEEAASRRLIALRQEELDRTRAYFPPAHSFLEGRVKRLFAESPVLEVMRRLPKGGVLHLHGGAAGDFRWLVEHATYRPDAYIYLGSAPQPPRGAMRIAPQSPGEGWRRIVDVRDEAADARAFDEELFRSITLGEEERDSPDVWAEFNRCFQRFSGLFADRGIYQEYWRRLLAALIEENVQYLESRSLPIDAALIQEAQRRDPDFDANFIVAAGRTASRERIAQTLTSVIDARAKDPRIVGFDLVEEEDRTQTNVFFLQEILAARRSAAQRGTELPLYLHSGETNWVDNENLYDAVLLGASRIGHGLALIRHPVLMQMVKARGIAVEICPISNQLLGYVSDLRTHPAVHYINAGLPIVLATDDPAIMQQSLSHDFYVAFMAWGADLRTLKQLAINSLTYSAMNPAQKQRALAAWQKRWDVFVTWINSH